MSTIRFEDLGKPIQQLLKSLNDGYDEGDLALMEYVSVKDMAKIYEELNAKKKAEQIWKELKKDLQRRKDEDKKKAQMRAIQEAENEEKRRELEEELARQEEEERAAEEKARRKKEKRERKRREAEELAAQEAAAAEAEAEAAAAEAEAAAAAEEAEEERQRRKEEKRRRKEERERERAAAAEAAAAKAAEEEAAEEARLAEEKARRKAEKKRLKKEAQKLADEQAALEEQKVALKAKKNAQTLAEQWQDHVKNHPLEFGTDDCEVIEQVQVERVTKRPPREFLCVKFIRIPDFTIEADGTCFYNLQVNLTNTKVQKAKARYNQFVELKAKLGGSLDQVQAPFPGKTFLKLKGDGLEKRRRELEVWINQVIQGLTTTRSYKGVQLNSKQQLRGDAARAEAERQRMQHAAVARQALYNICGLAVTEDEKDEE